MMDAVTRAAPAFTGISSELARSVRAHREARGMSLGALARAAGLAKTSLSTVEAGLSNPSLETLWRLAEALGVSLGTLLGEADPPRTLIVRSGEGTPFESPSGMAGRMILAEGRNHRTEVLDASVAAGADYRSAPHAPGTKELFVCTNGTVELGPVGQEVVLAAGDALWFPADLPHRYASETGAHGLVVMSYAPTPGHD
jgi:transcriptional regulator with XRE-family HTH domain